MRHTRLVAALLLPALAFCSAALTTSVAAAASTPPVIGSTSAVPATVHAGDQVELEWQFTGDVSGFTSSLQFNGPGAASIPSCTATAPVLVSGWQEAGTLAVTCPVPAATPVGSWSTTVHMVRTSDQQAFDAAGPSFTVVHGQTITFTSTPPNPASATGPTYTVTAQSTSGLTVVLTIDSNSFGCSIAGAVVTFDYAGPCVIDANQPGGAGVAPAPQVQQTIAVVGPPALTARTDHVQYDPDGGHRRAADNRHLGMDQLGRTGRHHHLRPGPWWQHPPLQRHAAAHHRRCHVGHHPPGLHHPGVGHQRRLDHPVRIRGHG